jgi:hypothetical protein
VAYKQTWTTKTCSKHHPTSVVGNCYSQHMDWNSHLLYSRRLCVWSK